MHAQRWFFTTLALIIAVAGAIAATNVSLDIYGIFHDARGRHLAAYGDQRVSKYLLSKRYVPENFDAILVGSSMSANWNTGKIKALRVYNESMAAANIVEEKFLVEQVLSHPSIKVALLIVHPFMTHSHRFATVELTDRETAGAMGSLQLWEAYKDVIRYRVQSNRAEYDEFGTDDFPEPKKLNPLLQRMMQPGRDFDVDPIALGAFKELVTALRQNNVQLVFIVPPIVEKLFLLKPSAFRKYFDQIQTVITVDDKLIDFTADSYQEFRKNPRNFADGIHLEREGADEVVSTIDTHLQQWIANGELVIRPSSQQ